MFVILNTVEPNSPLSKVKVRQALNMAVDRDGIIKAIMNGTAIKSNQPLTDKMFGYNPDVKSYAYDLTAAKKDQTKRL